MILEGLKEAEHVATGTTLTLPTHVFVPPALLATVKVQLWFAVGEKLLEPLAVVSVPLPKLPVQL